MMIWVYVHYLFEGRVFLELMDATDIGQKKLWIFDVDNTLIQDVEHPKPFDDALNLFRALHNAGKTIALLTNVGRLSARDVHRTIEQAGFQVDLGNIFTAGSAAAAYIERRKHNARCFVISEGGAIQDFVDRGLEVCNNPPIDYVAVGADRSLSFDRLNFAAKMLMDGADLICISGSRSYPGVYLGTEDVFMGERSIVAALEDATGKKAVIVGKPLAEIVQTTVHSLGFELDQAVLIGDNPQSDIAGGRAANVATVLVERNPDGIVPFDAGDLNTTPDITVSELDELVPYIK